MASVESNAVYRSVGTILTNTNETVCYTCPAEFTATLTSIRVSDNGGASGAARVEWHDDSASADYCVIHNGAFSANTALEIELKPLVLNPGDEIRVTGASGYHVIVSGLEEPKRRGR